MVPLILRPCPPISRTMGGQALSEDDRRCSFELPTHPRYVVQKYFSSTLDLFTVFSDGRMSEQQPCSKLRDRYIGPFLITEEVSPVAFRLKLPSRVRIHDVVHASLLD
jgi:hypothetical protein